MKTKWVGNKKLQDSEIRAAIETFAGDWIADTVDTYFDAVQNMIERGFDPQEALDLVEILYKAAAAEFGN